MDRDCPRAVLASSRRRARRRRCRASCAVESPTRERRDRSPTRASRSLDARTSFATATDGSFSVRGLEPREYFIRIRALGFVVADREVTVANGRTTTVDVALESQPAVLTTVEVRASRDSQPVNATTYDRAAIEASGRRDLGELLQSSPGVVITQAGGPGSASRVSIRGSSASEVLVLVDGVPINSQITGEADLSHVSLESVERVVVRSGAQSARYGGRALAGVVEITTRRASREASASIRDGAWGEREVSATLGDGRSLGGLRASGSITGEYRTMRGDFPYDVPAFRGGGTGRSDQLRRHLAPVSGRTNRRRRLDDAAGAWIVGASCRAALPARSCNRRQRGDRRITTERGVDALVHRLGITWVAAGDVTRERSTFVDPAPPFRNAVRRRGHRDGHDWERRHDRGEWGRRSRRWAARRARSTSRRRCWIRRRRTGSACSAPGRARDCRTCSRARGARVRRRPERTRR